MNWLSITGSLCGSLLLLILLLFVAFRAAVALGGRRVQPVHAPSLIRRAPEDARVERLANNDLRVVWDEPAGQVRVCAGGTPETIQWDRPLVVVHGAREALVSGLDPARRYYLGLEWDGDPARRRVAAERHLPLHGARNFRDLGGYRAADGRSVRWGRIFRSEQLDHLTDEDLAYLERLEIAAVGDLRASNERADEPDRLPAGAASHSLPVYEDLARAPLMGILLFRRHLLGETLSQGYRMFLDAGAASYGQLLRLAAEGRPLVYHCSKGKDRAGVATALLLGLLGVPEETILADYSLSNLAFDYFYQEFQRDGRLRAFGVPPHQMQVLFTVNTAWLANLLAYLREQYGSIENYLIHKAGLAPETIEQLRAQLLV